MLSSSASSTGPQFLVGRQRELLELQSLLPPLREQRGSLVLISGEAGMGKTSLVNSFVGGLATDDVQVFTGHCFDLETTPPYGPWLNSGLLDTARPGGESVTGQVSTLTPERRKILEFLADHGPSRPRDVAAALGISANAATQTLRRLLGENHVTQPSYGKYAAISPVVSDMTGATDPVHDAVRSSLTSAPGRQQLSERATQHDLFEEARNQLVRRSADRPIVLVLEDMHWADQASVEMLRFIARGLSNIPVLIIVTYRDVGLSHHQPLYKYLPYIVRESRTTRMALRRLNANDIRDLLERCYKLPADDEDRLLEHLQRYTDGNPFFIHEVLLGMEQDLQLVSDDGDWRLVDLDLAEIHVPPLLQQVIDGRLERLDEGVHGLLQIAAVIGSNVPIGLLQEVSGATDNAVLDAVEHAFDAELLEPLGVQPVIRFRHSLVREALYRSLLPVRSQSWHRRIAEVLSRQPNAELDAVAHHFRQGADSRAVEWLIRAGERAARQFDWLGAVDRFRAALEFPVGSPATDSHRAWLHFHIGMLSRRSDTDASLASLRTALDIAAREGDLFLQGLSMTALGLAHCIMGRIGMGLSDLESGVDILESLDRDELERFVRSQVLDDPLFVRLQLPDPASQRGILVHWLAVSGQYTAAIEMGSAFVERIPRRTSAASPFHFDDYYDAFMGLGHAYSMVGDTEHAAAALTQVRAGYSNDAQLPTHFLLYELGHLIEYNLDQPSERARVEQLIATVWESHRGMWFSQISGAYRPPRLLFWYGEWDAAEQMARGWDTTRRTTIARIASVALGRIALYRGNVEGAWKWVHTALSNEQENSFASSWCEVVLHAHGLAAELSLNAGDFDSFQRSLHVHGHLLESSGSQVGRAQHYLLHSRYHLRLGDLKRALAYAEQALAVTTKPHRPIPRLLSHRTMGSLLTLEGRYDEAAAHLSAAYDLAVRCTARYEAALTCAVQTRLMIATGKSAAARRKLTEARSVATQLGAHPLLAELTELSELLAGSEGKRTLPGGLSPRELEVLTLVARGLTDAEIADELFLSPRTVSGHLHSIYNKLGISSRAAATAYAYTQHLL